MPVNNLVLLNQSQFLPNQIIMGSLCFLTFLAIWVLSFRWLSLWDGYIRDAAWLFLAVALGVLAFKLVEVLPFLRPYNLQPLAHMLEEIGCLGAYAYIARYQGAMFPNVVSRPRLSVFLSYLPHLLIGFWVAASSLGLAAALGLLPPFDMTGLYHDLPGWSVFYRALFLVPGFVFCTLFTFLFLEHAIREDTNTRWTMRLTLFAVGSFTWVLLTVVGMTWAIAQAYGSAELRDTLAYPQIFVEAGLFLFMGASWCLGLTIPYRPNPTDTNKYEHRQLQRLSAKFTDLLSNSVRLVPTWQTTCRRLRRAGRHFKLSESTQIKAQKAITAVALLDRDEGALRAEAMTLLELHQRLTANLPQDSPEHQELLQNPVYDALAVALLLTDHAPDHENAPDQDLWVEVTAGLSIKTLHLRLSDSNYPSKPVLDVLEEE